jgi:uncharacterized protein
MEWVPRYGKAFIERHLDGGKAIALYGPRRTGKTSLVHQFLADKNNVFEGSGDDAVVRELLASQDKERLVSAFKGFRYIFIDEAQRVPEVGWSLKLMVDNLPRVNLFITGSSSFSLSGQIGEPLTGRQWTTILYPIAALELEPVLGRFDLGRKLDTLLTYGSYPEIVTAPNDQTRVEYLKNLCNSYLFKDILELENIRNSIKLTQLLSLLAFQIGNEVSLNELGNALGLAKQTVERYLDLLEKAFIIKRIGGFSRNLRKEVVKTARYYFYDNGVRNTIINNFNVPSLRQDVGMLWENFCVMERLKKQEYHQLYANNYFWRTYDGQEIDWVEEREGMLHGFEFKWKAKKNARPPAAWANNYPNSTFAVITPDNWMDFVL